MLYYFMAAGRYEFKQLRNIDRRIMYLNLKKKSKKLLKNKTGGEM